MVITASDGGSRGSFLITTCASGVLLVAKVEGADVVAVADAEVDDAEVAWTCSVLASSDFLVSVSKFDRLPNETSPDCMTLDSWLRATKPLLMLLMLLRFRLSPNAGQLRHRGTLTSEGGGIPCCDA